MDGIVAELQAGLRQPLRVAQGKPDGRGAGFASKAAAVPDSGFSRTKSRVGVRLCSFREVY